MNFQRTDFTCMRDGLRIRGLAFLPEMAGKRPAIIFSHGFTGNYLGSISWCEDFASRGYATFCFNFCGGGTPEDDPAWKSDGETTQMSLRTEVADLTAVLDSVRAHPAVDENDVTLAGFSQGGAVSGLTAAKQAEKVRRLIMVFPALCIPDHARMGCLGGAQYDPEDPPECIRCPRTLLGRSFHEEAAQMDIFLELAAFKGPVLILHGIEDGVVSYAYSIRARENYRKGQCHLQLVRGMGHAFDEGQQESLAASMRQFLNGREEILAIRVILTKCERAMEGEICRQWLYFGGYCETPYFRGTVLPGGVDAQVFEPGQPGRLRAEYTLDGLDAEGDHCTIHIVNQWGGEDWTPVAQTDSKALSFLNGAALTAVLEHGDGGPTVRIFAER